LLVTAGVVNLIKRHQVINDLLSDGSPALRIYQILQSIDRSLSLINKDAANSFIV
jgi:hypothetical protein